MCAALPRLAQLPSLMRPWLATLFLLVSAIAVQCEGGPRCLVGRWDGGADALNLAS